MKYNGIKYCINVSLVVISVIFGACNSKTSQQEPILLYCAAGIKPAVAEIAKKFEKEYNIKIDIQYGGSGTLLSNLRVARQGDLYIAADQSYMEMAREFGLLAETQPLAILSPVIAVKKGNIKNIRIPADLLNQDVNVALGNPGAASIGKLTKQIFEELQLWEALKEKVTVFKPTVNDVANDIQLGTVDAGIIWDATAKQFEALEAIPIEGFHQYQNQITVGVLNYTKQPKEALMFLRYLSSCDRGNPVFEAHGYIPVKGDKWAVTPEILLFSGGVNRVAVEETIKAFEAREGVRVTRVYNGCGILVSQIKAGAKPDAYLSCDVSFMDDVQSDFTNIENISSTRIVIATQKGNPLRIESFKDLGKKDLRIGVCNPEQSALGALTQNMLKRKNIWDDIEPNIYSQTPTADLLVNQLRTSSLDAVIVYEANLSQVKDKLTMVQVDDDDALATQNFGLGTNSEYPFLTSRLFDALLEEQSKQRYLENGFHWTNNR